MKPRCPVPGWNFTGNSAGPAATPLVDVADHAVDQSRHLHPLPGEGVEAIPTIPDFAVDGLDQAQPFERTERG